ncbi:MAG: hypothetical protein EXQ98_02900 [Alphaproteobacteria bacterium]|nr:hypothetical protein [Alphaproteobacteria bacterium]
MTASNPEVRSSGFLSVRIGRHRAVQIAVAIGLLAAVFLSNDHQRLGNLFSGLSVWTFVIATALILANQIMSSLRFHYLASEFGVAQSLRRSFYVNTMSIVGGLAFMNFIGQGATRAALMADSRSVTSTVFLITAVERVSSLAMLLLLAIISTLLALGGLSIAEKPGTMLAVFVSILAFILVTATKLAFGRKQQRELRLIFSVAIGPLGWRILGITFAMHACMILAYLTVAANLIHAAFSAKLVAASTIVMMAASFPISFGGWGIRELTASYVFEAGNLPSEIGVTMGLTIGLLSLIAVLLNVAIAFFVNARPQRAIDAGIGESQRRTSRAIRALAWLAPALAAILVNVQVQLPTTKSSVSANLADPIVIVAGLTMLLFVLRDSVARTLWRIPHFNLALGLMGATLVAGFFHGWIRFGLTDWALYNRLVGLGIVLAYLLTGALATAAAGQVGTRSLFRALVIACAGVVLTEWVGAYILSAEVALKSMGWYSTQFSGLIGNRNAFAMVLLLVLAVAVSGRQLWHRRRGAVLQGVVLGLLAWGIYLTGSRGVGVAALAVLIFLAAIPKCRKPLLHVAFGAALITGIFSFGNAVSEPASGSVANMQFGWGLRTVERYGFIQADRMDSLAGGLRMWFDYPIFGAGLGAFMHDWTAKTGAPLVIHNTFLWLMAEFGAVGLITFLSALGLIVVYTLRKPRWVSDESSVTALACIVVFAVVSLTHDVAYQRVFWLLIGALIARPDALRRALKNRSLLSRKETV